MGFRANAFKPTIGYSGMCVYIYLRIFVFKYCLCSFRILAVTAAIVRKREANIHPVHSDKSYLLMYIYAHTGYYILMLNNI